jgi:Tol biopolymer transport system component/DNA-binding winged helix-turn-helix (wHTH) protein
VPSENAVRVRFGEFELDPRAGELRRGRVRIRLQEQPLQILLVLLERPGEVVTREEIRRRLWPNDTIVEFDHSIGTAIKKLRQALGDEAGSPRYVETLPRRGFRFIFHEFESIAGVDESPGTDAEAQRAGAAVSERAAEPLATARAGRSRWPLAVAGLVIVLLCALGWLGWLLLKTSRVPAGETLDRSTLVQVTSSTGLDFDPALSPDGSFLAYSSNQDGNFEIYVKPLAVGSREVQLTSDGEENFEPAWSPDGKQIAYYSQKRGGIWLIPALGGAPRLLSDFGSRPEWSPDGSMIAFQSAVRADLGIAALPAMPPSTIWIVGVQGGVPRQLTYPGNPAGGHGAPVWSPDGKTIAFNTTNTSFGEIWSVAASGGAPVRILGNGVLYPVYAPNGKALYFTKGFGPSFLIMRVALSPSGTVAGAPELIDDTGQVLRAHLRFSANGKFATFSQLAAVNNLQSLRISPVTGNAASAPEALTHNTDGRKTGPLFSPDGKTIAYSIFQVGEHFNVWLTDPDGKNARPADAGQDTPLFQGWFPDSHRIAYTIRDNGHNILESLDVVSGRKEVLRELGVANSTMRLSPDGRQIAYDIEQDGVPNIWTVPVGGGPPRQLTFAQNAITFPCWSPDGKFLAAQVSRNGGAQIVLIPADGGTPIQLTADQGDDNWPHDWSPDGDKIAFAGQRNGIWNIYWISRGTREEKQLTHYTHNNAYVRYPAWSPRGDQIVYEYAETTGNIWTMRVK